MKKYIYEKNIKKRFYVSSMGGEKKYADFRKTPSPLQSKVILEISQNLSILIFSWGGGDTRISDLPRVKN